MWLLFPATDLEKQCWLQSVPHYIALTRTGVRVALGGRHVMGPPGIIDADGFADLTGSLPSQNGRS